MTLCIIYTVGNLMPHAAAAGAGAGAAAGAAGCCWVLLGLLLPVIRLQTFELPLNLKGTVRQHVLCSC